MVGSARTIQRAILIAGALVIILMGLFPPYVLVTPAIELNGVKQPEKMIAVGYYLIFDPPPAIEPNSLGLNRIPLAATPIIGESLLDRTVRQIQEPGVAQRLPLVRIDVARFGVQLATVTIAVVLLAYAFRPNPLPLSPHA